MNPELESKCKLASAAASKMADCPATQKNKALENIAVNLEKDTGIILQANKKDLDLLESRGNYTRAFADRLLLDENRILQMAEGLRDIAALEDPVGEVTGMWKRPNGLEIGTVRVPIGVIGIIYEARPNVTVDAAGLALKAGNAVVLRGGSEALHSNLALVEAIKAGLSEAGLPEQAVFLVEDTGRDAALALMKAADYLDLLIPRGGRALIKTVVENASVPVIQTGAGNCHTYVDFNASIESALEIAVNAKVQRPGVCNAMETLLVHRSMAPSFLPQVSGMLQDHGVEIRGCPETQKILPGVNRATEEDWETEYLDLILAVKVVEDVNEAIEHINRYGSGHSEAIITESYEHSRLFLGKVDAAAVYVNASTRFTDGSMFGLGAEMGISTQKLHVRGPMGLKALTSLKYVVYGSGQTRS